MYCEDCGCGSVESKPLLEEVDSDLWRGSRSGCGCLMWRGGWIRCVLAPVSPVTVVPSARCHVVLEAWMVVSR